MRTRLRLKMQKPRRPRATSAPTLTGTTTEGFTLTFGDPTFDMPLANIERRYSRVTGLAENWSVVANANASTFLIPVGYVGDRLRPEARGLGPQGWGDWFVGVPTEVINEAPDAPLLMTATPLTSASQGSPYSFLVTVTGGDGDYDDGDLTGEPSGLHVTRTGLNTYLIEGPITAAGLFDDINFTVRDGGGAGDPASLVWDINVASSAGLPKLSPGGGWTGVTAAPAARGSAANVGYGYECFLAWAVEQFPTITGEQILEVVAGHTGPRADWIADGTPLFGMYSVEASVDNGPWVLIPPSFNSAKQIYSYRFKIDAADFADGTWKINGKREVRVRGVGKNGLGFVLQGSTDVWPYAFPGFFFSTNKNGTLSTPVKYVDIVGGNDSNAGTTGSPYKTIAKAMTSGAMVTKLKAGTGYSMSGVTTQLSDDGRWRRIEADDGLAPSQVRVSAGGSADWRVPRTRLKGLTHTSVIPLSTNYALAYESCVCDQGDANKRVGTRGPYNYNAAGALVYMTDTDVTNYAFGPTNARLVSGCDMGVIVSDVFTNCLVVLNCTVDVLLAGQSESSPGVWDGGSNFHPDTLQLNRGAPTASEYWWGAYHCNVDITTGQANGQGPFFKDCGAIQRVFLINWEMVLKPDLSKGYSPPNVERNAIYLQNTETMKNSMFYDLHMTNGIRAWSGPCDDVVAINMTLMNMLSNANSVPSQILNYTP